MSNDFYLGRIVDEAGERTEIPLNYDSDDLTTHAVIVGMTGSGKTGLCIDLLEEAALNNVPAIMIDPKGDITNALLHFPDLLPADFKPWVNADQARRAGKSLDEAAAGTADLWRNGLAEWGIGPERIQSLKDSVDRAVYTPGSESGLPISILASLAAPAVSWDGNNEMLREKISGTVTALLGLVGLTDIDPVRSREHILLSNIFEHAWRAGKDLTLEELIIQTQNPPFEKLGVFDVATFFPDKDRFGLAMDLNNILASPAFQSWIKGEPLDVASLLYTPEGKARHSIFYIAHLNDEERMFFVTLLYSAVESWMRTQAGTTTLRALVYFDEIFGYLPPIGNPPSKEPMLRMLKQARAFGVGMVLATQNPVDVDYKALSNAGTWFIGRLGTDQDKQRLLDGLSTAMGGGVDRQTFDRMISALGKRMFILRNVHDKMPSVFQTRWAMNYLAGPVTRQQIPALNALAGASVRPAASAAPRATGSAPAQQAGIAAAAAPAAPPAAKSPMEGLGTLSQPKVPSSVDEYILPIAMSPRDALEEARRPVGRDVVALGVLYRPILLAQLQIAFNNRKYDVYTDLNRTLLVDNPDERGRVRWEDYQVAPIAEREFERLPEADARFASIEPPLSDARVLKSLLTDLKDWGYRESELRVWANEKLKLFAGPDVSEDDFEVRCDEAAAELMGAEMKKVAASYDKKEDALRKKLRKEEIELEQDRDELSARKREETTKHLETVIGLFSKRRRSLSGSMTKRRMTSKAKADVEESIQMIADLRDDIEDLGSEERDALQVIEEKWEEIADDITQMPITPFKKDVNVALYGVAWLPYHVVENDGRLTEVPAFVTAS